MIAVALTQEDRKVLSKMLEDIKAISVLKEPGKYFAFLKAAIKVAQRRKASSYVDRFTDMLLGSQLQYRAYERRRDQYNQANKSKVA